MDKWVDYTTAPKTHSLGKKSKERLKTKSSNSRRVDEKIDRTASDKRKTAELTWTSD